MLKHKIIYNGEEIEFFLKRSLQKNIYFKYHQAEKIIISAPLFVNIDVIKQFVITSWIKIKTKQEKNKYYYLFSYSEDDRFMMLFNKKYRISVLTTNKNNKWKVVNEEVILFLKNNDQSDIIKTVNKIIKKYAEQYLPGRLEYWAKLMSLEFQSWQIRHMKSKWGLCYYKRQKIVLNYFLAQLPIEIIDYVLIHELAHLAFPNHSQSFWIFVEKYCDDLKNKRKFLRSIIL